MALADCVFCAKRVLDEEKVRIGSCVRQREMPLTGIVVCALHDDRNEFIASISAPELDENNELDTAGDCR